MQGHTDTGLYRIPVAGGPPTLITRTKAPATDGSPAFSPNGRELAYVNCIGGRGEDVTYTSSTVDSTFSPVGPPRRLTTQLATWITSVAWTRDGQDVIYDQSTGGDTFYLWRMSRKGSSEPRRIEAAGARGSLPSNRTFTRPAGLLPRAIRPGHHRLKPGGRLNP